MYGFPYYTHRIDTDRLLLRENRVRELLFDDLSAQELETVIHKLKAKFWRMRRRALAAHLTGASLTVCFLALGLAVMMIGLAETFGFFNAWGLPSIPGRSSHWVILVLLAGFGGFAADYMLRRRLKVARMWSHVSERVGEAILRAEAQRRRAESSSVGDDLTASTKDASPISAAVSTLRSHVHYLKGDVPVRVKVVEERRPQWESHYLIDRLSEVASGEAITAEAQTALRTAARHLREDCDARAEADALQRWIETHVEQS